ncbi:MAG: 4Fe-4S binding protein [Thermoanaerobacteraceae bacterium]|nr:4Fe-4S binding protein [Thermoanaerobacteraceae bacterium]
MKKINFKKELCMACHNCELGCATVHSKGKSLISVMEENVMPRIHIIYNEKKSSIVAEQCKQCKKPKCVEACPVGALSQNEEGMIVVDFEKCTGCGECEKACPFNAIRIREKCIKCDLCEGVSDIPACVMYCPAGALTYKES